MAILVAHREAETEVANLSTNEGRDAKRIPGVARILDISLIQEVGAKGCYLPVGIVWRIAETQVEQAVAILELVNNAIDSLKIRPIIVIVEEYLRLPGIGWYGRDLTSKDIGRYSRAY